ncbi:AAA family ATPase [Prevotella sp. PINT]|nr:AAA family ATPase [Palleniella intestinalis]NPD82643.1 AAA family ATPase [Palleniella intestinalis]
MDNIQIDPQNREQQLAYELIANTNSSFFLTGRAGTGKTTFLHNVQKMVNKQFIILAPTGVAAILAGGETIHSFFGLPMEVCSPGTCGKMNETRILALLHADTIIIDEVSMVRCDIIDAIDYTMRKKLRNNMPFGGKQMVFVGDMFQLPPVVKQGPERDILKDIYDADDFFFYKSMAVSRMRLVKIEFRKVYRQDDEKFLHILENVRKNRITPENIMHLNNRVCTPTDEDGMVITLTAVRSVADSINEQRLNAIDTKEYIYEGTVEGRFEEKRFPVSQRLKLKVGAQVMFARNDQWHRWANGTLGIVEKLTKEEIHVKVESGDTYVVPCCSWESFSYEYDREERKLKKEVGGTFTQYPLVLAWAITIHKSQGMTFEKLSVDLSRGMFASGQLYVALSRVRSLEGLFLSRPVVAQYARTNREIIAYANGYNDLHQIDNEIESGKVVFASMKNNDYDTAARQYLLLIQKRAVEGDIKEAMQLSKRFLETVICDDDLFGCISEIPQELFDKEHWAARFLVALLSLYAGECQQALDYADKVLLQHQCSEILYVKARALTRLERYKEADEVHCKMVNTFDMTTPDAKIIYTIAMLNEMHIGEPGLDIMRKLVEIKPKYDRGIMALRLLMRKRGMQLPNENSELVDAFNSDMSDDEFLCQLKECREKAPKAVAYLVRCIRLHKTGQ